MIECRECVLFYRSLDGFTKSSVRAHIEEKGPRFTAQSVDTYPQTETSLHTEKLGYSANQGDVTTSTSTASSVNTLGDSPTGLDFPCQQVGVSLPQQLPSHCSGCAVFNNYLLHQDSLTGHLTLVPVQVRAPESILGLDVNLSLVPKTLLGQTTILEGIDDPFMNCLTVSVRSESQEYGPPQSYFNGSFIISDNPQEHTAPRAYNGQTNPRSQGENQSPSESNSPRVDPALQEVIDLLKGEFAFDGYLENGQEDIAMGMYLSTTVIIDSHQLLTFTQR